jgi:hypothetical protein
MFPYPFQPESSAKEMGRFRKPCSLGTEGGDSFAGVPTYWVVGAEEGILWTELTSYSAVCEAASLSVDAAVGEGVSFEGQYFAMGSKNKEHQNGKLKIWLIFCYRK